MKAASFPASIATAHLVAVGAFDEKFEDSLQRALEPSAADIAVARAVILEHLGRDPEPVVLTAFEDAWLKVHRVQRAGERDGVTAVISAEEGRRFADPDPADPYLVNQRCRHAVRWAIAQLGAEGVLVRGEGNQYPIQPTRIPVTYPGGGDSASVFVHSPYIGDYGNTPRYLLAHPAQKTPTDVLLPAEEMLSGLDDLLGARGMQLVRESRRALHRGLFLASSSLLAAASEAAWFNLARAVPAPSPKLAGLVEEGRDAAMVIHLTAQVLSERRVGSQSARTEVVAQGHLFRQIRNYALHPVEPHDRDREAWLTESGATLLALTARRYLVQMADLQARVKRSSAPPRSTD